MSALRRPATRSLRTTDAAASELMGSMLTVGIIVTIIASSIALTPKEDPQPDLHPVDYIADAQEGNTAIQLIHSGGNAIDLTNVQVLVEIDSREVFRGPLGPSGTLWQLGDAFTVGPLTEPIPHRGRIEVKLLRDMGSETITIEPINRYELAAFDRPTNGGGMSIELAFGNTLNHTRAQPTETLFVEAIVAHPEGRKLIESVMGRIDGLNLAWSPLYDDGTHGDLVAGDGNHSAELVLPVDAPAGAYPFTLVAVDLYGNRATVVGTVNVGPIIIPPPPRALPPFIIDPSGAVRPRCDGPFRLDVVGTDITYGPDGPRIPVYVDWTRDGSTLTPLFNGNDVSAGLSYTNPLVRTTDTIGVRGTADGFGFRHAYMSYTSDPHVRVLQDGDAVPTIPGYGTQIPIEKQLAPYVSQGRISLAQNEVIVLYEFVPDLNTTAADYQDLVLLFTFPGGTCAPAPSSIESNFNGSPIPAGGYIWFNSHANLQYAQDGTTLRIRGQHVTFTSQGTDYDIAIPDADIHVTSTVPIATTTWDSAANRWITTVPTSYTGNIFMAGLAAPMPNGLAGGTNPVTWNAAFLTNQPGLTLSWQWSAAVYTNFASDPNDIGAKPTDGSTSSNYPNAHQAGTPENMTAFVTGGARGGGGSDYTGSWSSTGHATATVEQAP